MQINPAYVDKPRVMIAHTGRQHSHQLAWALQEGGMRVKYLHGSFLPPDGQKALAGAELEMLPLSPAVRRLANIFVGESTQKRFYYYADLVFDRYSARLCRHQTFDAVIGYEATCLELFRAARAEGVACVLDAASLHHSFQDRYVTQEGPQRFLAAKTSRKDAEIELADAILTCSPLATRSYIEAGIDPRKLITLPLGADTPSNRDRLFDIRPNDQKPSFLFVGHYSSHKGADILMDAIRLLRNRAFDFSITVVARPNGSDICKQLSREANCIPRLTSPELEQLYADHDCLLLPSRFDSYGMVVAEALMQGTPAIVSENVGASFLVQDTNVGKVIAVDDAAVLADEMEVFARDIEQWRARRFEIHQSMVGNSWQSYRRAAFSEVAGVLQKMRRPSDDLSQLESDEKNDR